VAKYRVLEKSYIGSSIRNVGEIVDIEFTDGGVAGPNLELLDAPKKAKKPTKAVETDDSGDGSDLT
jgi:hypothetical protein